MTRGGWYESVATRVQYCQPLVATEPPKARPFLEFQKCKSLGGTFQEATFGHFWLPGRSVRDRGALIRVRTNPSPMETSAERNGVGFTAHG